MSVDNHTSGADGADVSGYPYIYFIPYFIEKHIYNSNQNEMPQLPQERKAGQDI